MKRKITAFTLALCMAMSLAACGGADNGSNGSANTQSGNFIKDKDNAGEATEITLTVQSHRLESEDIFVPEEDPDYPSEPFTYAYVTYDTFSVPDEVRKAYPNLADALDKYNANVETENLTELAGNVDMAASDAAEGWLYTSYEMNSDISVLRADERVFSCVVVKEAFYGGVHPMTWYESINIDTQTGEYIPLSDTINGTSNMKSLPGIVYKNLETVTDLDETEIEEEFQTAGVFDTLKEKIASGEITYTMDEKGLNAYFSAYELMYYAFGPIFCDLTVEEYPELMVEKYRPVETRTPLEKRIKYEDTDTVTYSDSELAPYLPDESEGEAEGYTYDYMYVDCPDWGSSYAADGIADTLTASPLKFNMVSKESIVFADDWAFEKNITLPEFGFGSEIYYEDGNYVYYAENDADNGYIALTLTDSASGEARKFDFSQYLVTPNAGNEFTTSYIRYAEAADGVLYTEITHMTYSADQPDTAYIVAIDIDSMELLWRSDTLVANANNFVIGQDTIICGYGFTDEDDYIYVLSRESGRMLDKIKVKTAPDYFIPEDDSLYVVCYDVAYEFNIEEE